MKKIFLIGATGRMGKAIQDVVEQEKKKLVVAGGIGQEQKGGMFSTEFPRAGAKNKKISYDVAIDFSSVELFTNSLDWCVENKIPLVSGVTGITEQHKKQLVLAAKKIPVLWAPNMSMGVAIVKNILTTMNMPEMFDVHLLEYHHRYKKDAPSGTAKDLEEVLKKRSKKFAGTSAIRGGGIFGVHRVDFMADSEVITIQHQALDRHVFAKGAVSAAQWLMGQKKGLFSMQDVLR